MEAHYVHWKETTELKNEGEDLHRMRTYHDYIVRTGGLLHRQKCQIMREMIISKTAWPNMMK
jgi:hypothetical protein